MAKIVIGMDGGGTYTRAVAADLSGHVLATVTTDAASPNKTANAQENVQNAIREAVSRSGHTLTDVVGLVAGIAGLDSPEDQEWANKFTDVPGLNCPRLHVNDAIVAHAGALESQPGIIAISGTGSIIFAATESGQHIRNYDFHHYAYSAARYLSYDVVYRLLAGDIQPEDSGFIAEVLAFWEAKDLTELRERGIVGFSTDRFERNRLFGEMAPLVTTAALQGVPLARTACDAAIDGLAVGIRLLGNCFTSETVSIAFIGSVVNSNYVRQGIANALAKSVTRQYRIVGAAFSSEVGAVLMALSRHGVAIDGTLISSLRVTLK